MENVKHALVLEKWLREWPEVTSLNLWDEELTRRERGVVRAGRDELLGTTKNVIVTTEGLPYAGQFDVLVRADAGEGSAFLFNYVNEILIDLDHHKHPVLQKRAKRRRQAYLERRWSVGDKTKVDEPLQWFMATRKQLEGTKRNRGRK